MTSRPNILIVYADQWRAQAAGYAGNTDIITPHLDAFAANGVNCRVATAGTPVCTPARASLLTGMYPHKHGLFLNDVPLDPDFPSIGKTFAAAGYRTGWVGKWHVDGHGRYACIPRERRQGFDFWMALECTHDYNHSRYYAGDSDEQLIWPGYDAFPQTDALIDWIANGDKRPFLGVLSWGPPHNPYETAPEQYRRMYDPAAISLPANVPPEKRDDTRGPLTGYYAHCTALDDCFGRLVAALDTHGLADNTLVLFTSDHGDMVGSHYLYDKQCPWEESVRVPFLMRLPGVLKPGVSDLLIDSPDIFPTLCGFAGIDAPRSVQGRDLSNHLRAGTTPADDCALLAAYHTFGNWPWIAAKLAPSPLYAAREYRGVRTKRYTYVEDLIGPWLLYDNEADPCQLRNLIDDPAHAALRAKLAALLLRRREALGDDFLPGKEYIRQWGYQTDERGTIPCPGWKG